MDRTEQSKNNYVLRTVLLSVLATIAVLANVACIDTNSCVVLGTMIWTPQGETKVEELKVGDWVFSYDLVQQEVVPARIVRIRSAFEDCVEFRSNTGIHLGATLSHQIYSPQTGKYEEAAKWSSDELREFGLVLSDNSFAIRNSFEVVPIGRRYVFDITVESPFANFIANGILVHNKSFPPEVTQPIHDLASIQQSDSSITLSWTIPGNSSVFTESYDMRFSDSGIVLSYPTWERYDSVSFSNPPGQYGTRDTIEVAGLSSNTPYWFNIRTISNQHGYSDFSNVVVDTTLP